MNLPINLPRLSLGAVYAIVWGLVLVVILLHHVVLPLVAPVQVAQVEKVLTWTREAGAVGLLVAGGIGALVYRRWSRGKQEERNRELAQKGRLLLVALPEGFKAKPETAQEVFLGLQAALNQSGRKIRRGEGHHISLEITKTAFGIGTYIWAPDLTDEGLDLVREVTTQIRAVYPDAFAGVIGERPEEIILGDGDTSGSNGTPGDGGKAAVFWADLKLARPGHYPIRTEFVRGMDPVRTLMQTLTTGGGVTGAGVQLLLHPASSGWQRAGAREVQSTKQRWNNLNRRRSMIPDAEKDLVDAIERKKDQFGYDIVVRVWVAGDDPEAAQMRLGELIRAFQTFSHPQGGNAFTVADRDAAVVTWDDQADNPVFGRHYPSFAPAAVLNPEELAVMWHLPDDTMPIPGLLRGAARSIPPAPHLIPGQIAPEDDFCVMGEHTYSDGSRADLVGFEWEAMEKHTFIDGPNGTGKSTLLHHIALQSLEAGQSTIVLDPHSKLVYDIAQSVPAERERDVILIDFADPRRNLGLNMFDMGSGGEDLERLSAEIMTILQKIVGANWDVAVRMQRLLGNALGTLLDVLDDPTMIEFYKMFADPAYSEVIGPQARDPILRTFWEQWNQQSESQRNDAYQTPLTRLEKFLTNKTVRRIVGQSDTTIDLRSAMDSAKLVLVDVGVSRMGEANAEFVGTVMMSLLRMSAMSRLREPHLLDSLPRTMVIIDEAHRFMVGDEARQMLSEMRKTHTGLVFATQYDKQFPDAVRAAVRGNIGNLVAFRLGRQDAGYWAPYFGVDSNEMLNLPRFGVYAWSDSKIGSADTFPPPDPVSDPPRPTNGRTPLSPDGEAEQDAVDLLKRLPKMSPRQRVDTLVDLSDDEWETYRRVRKQMDANKLTQLKANPAVVPDKVERLKVRTMLHYGTPAAEADADVLRRTGEQPEDTGDDDWLSYD
jgi:energy-coupling factor transporter ATP-binding protein EcfA2